MARGPWRRSARLAAERAFESVSTTGGAPRRRSGRHRCFARPHKFPNEACALIGFIPPRQMADAHDFEQRLRHELRGGIPGVGGAERIVLAPDKQGWLSDAAQL